jgi:hypothetical protein
MGGWWGTARSWHGAGVTDSAPAPVRRRHARFRPRAPHCIAGSSIPHPRRPLRRRPPPRRLAPSTPTFPRPRPPLSGAASGLVSRLAPPRGSPDGCAVEEATRRPGMASRPPTKRRTARPWRSTLGYVGGDVEQRYERTWRRLPGPGAGRASQSKSLLFFHTMYCYLSIAYIWIDVPSKSQSSLCFALVGDSFSFRIDVLVRDLELFLSQCPYMRYNLFPIK